MEKYIETLKHTGLFSGVRENEKMGLVPQKIGMELVLNATEE